MEIALAVAVVLLVLERVFGRRDVGVLLGQVGQLIVQARAERDALITEFARERGELLLRVQHPSVIVPPRISAEQQHVEEPEEDEFDMVGQVLPTLAPDEDPRTEADA